MKNLRTSAARRLCHRASSLQPAGSPEMVTPGGAAQCRGFRAPERGPAARRSERERRMRRCARRCGRSPETDSEHPTPTHARRSAGACVRAYVRVCVCARMHTRTPRERERHPHPPPAAPARPPSGSRPRPRALSQGCPPARPARAAENSGDAEGQEAMCGGRTRCRGQRRWGVGKESCSPS